MFVLLKLTQKIKGNLSSIRDRQPNMVIYLLVKFDIVYHFCVLLFVIRILF